MLFWKIFDEVDESDEPGFWAAVRATAKYGFDKVLTRLLAENPEMLDKNFLSKFRIAFNVAIDNGHDKVIELLLDRHPELLSVVERGNVTPLHRAARFGQGHIVELMLARDPTLIDAMDSDGRTVFHYAAVHPDNGELVSRLAACRPELIKKQEFTYDFTTALHVAAQQGNAAVVAQLLAHSPQSSGIRNIYDETALHLAASNNQTKVIAQLLAHDPSLIDALASEKRNALHSAANRGASGAVAQLLHYKPSLIGVKAVSGNTALHLAACSGHVEVVAYLLARWPEMVEEKDDSGWTPLQQAARLLWEPVVEVMLLIKPSLVEAIDPEGCTLLHRTLCQQYNDCQIRGAPFSADFCRRVFRMHPAALHHLNKKNQSPFQIAYKLGKEWALDLFRWQMSCDQIMEEYARCSSGNMKAEWAALKGLKSLVCTALAGLLLPELVKVVDTYVFAPERKVTYFPRTLTKRKATTVEKES